MVSPIILGIDPGTTTGYAIVDLHGKLVKKGSAKNISMSSLINKIIRSGKPILIGCDKKVTPGFVEKMASRLGAKIVHPNKDLLKQEKKELVKMKIKSDHESDALASALFAYETVKRLFYKIDAILEKKEKRLLADSLKEFMVKHEKMNIEEAIRVLEKKPEPKKFKKPKQRTNTEPVKELDRLEKRILILEEKNKHLQSQFGEAKKKSLLLERSAINIEKDPVIKQKDKMVALLNQRIKELKLQTYELTKKLHCVGDFIADVNDKVLLKKLDTLSMKEYDDKKFLKIKAGDILLVKNPNIVNDKLLEILRGKVRIIFHKEKVCVNKGFVYINARNIRLQHIDNYALIEKKELDGLLMKANVLDNVLEEYKEERFKS
ncbi:MAG: DUF460 domain-containing protein [archaeon]